MADQHQRHYEPNELVVVTSGSDEILARVVSGPHRNFCVEATQHYGNTHWAYVVRPLVTDATLVVWHDSFLSQLKEPTAVDKLAAL